jgi:hypothetical protein
VGKRQRFAKGHRARNPVILVEALLYALCGVNRPHRLSAEDNIANFILSRIEKPVTRLTQSFEDALPLPTQTLRISFQKTIIIAQTNVNLLHRCLKFLLALLVVLKNADTKRLKWLDDFLSKYTQSPQGKYIHKEDDLRQDKASRIPVRRS